MRAANGLSAPTENAALTAAARNYAQYHFLSTDPFSLNHFLDGDPFDRASREGYYGTVGEILLTTANPSAQQMVDLWMGSPTHRDIILGPMFSELGAGCYQGPYTYDGATITATLCAGEFGAR